MYGCLMITIDCNAKEKVTVHFIILAFVVQTQKRTPTDWIFMKLEIRDKVLQTLILQSDFTKRRI